MSVFNLFAKLFSPKTPQPDKVQWPDLEFSDQRASAATPSKSGDVDRAGHKVRGYSVPSNRVRGVGPNNPDFSVAKWVMREAFDAVISQTDIPGEMHEGFFRDIYAAQRTGASRAVDAVVVAYLEEVAWQWPEFDRWGERFQETGEYPYMWRKYPALLPSSDAQKGIAEILKPILFGRIKEVLSQSGYSGRAPRKKAEALALLKETMPEDRILEAFREDLEELEEEKEDRREIARCHILSHTMTAVAYQLLHAYQMAEVTCRPKGTRLWATPFPDCPVEASFAKKFNRGDAEGYPPFFPGDRTGVYMKYPRPRKSK